MPPLPADSIHARACKLKCEKILTRPNPRGVNWESIIRYKKFFLKSTVFPAKAPQEPETE